MADHFFFHNVPAIHFSFIECDLDQLNKLSLHVDALSERLDQAKRGVTSLNLLQARFHNNRVVRCTPQSVKVTAAARYAPSSDGLDLSSITINAFVGLVTFLPLPDIKTLASNTDALRKCDLFFERIGPNARWGTYYTHLTACNPDWAQRFFHDIQKNLAAVTNSPNKITVQYSSRLPIPSNSDPNTEVLPHTLPISFQAKDPPTLAFKQNASIRSSGNDQLSKETSLYLHALKAKEKAWGSEDITTLDTVYDIGKLYTKQGKFVEAEEMYVRALSGFEKALGANHDRTLKVADDLEVLHSLVAAKVAAQGQ